MERASVNTAATHDRRAAHRFLIEPIEVRDPETGHLQGSMVECSVAGALLITEAAWLPGSQHRIGIRMLTGQGISWVSAAVECVRCRPDISAGHHAVSLRFIGSNPAIERAIEDLVAIA